MSHLDALLGNESPKEVDSHAQQTAGREDTRHKKFVLSKDQPGGQAVRALQACT